MLTSYLPIYFLDPTLPVGCFLAPRSNFPRKPVPHSYELSVFVLIGFLSWVLAEIVQLTGTLAVVAKDEFESIIASHFGIPEMAEDHGGPRLFFSSERRIDRQREVAASG